MQNVSNAHETQLNMIVNNVAVTPVYALRHITMCAGHVCQRLVIMLLLLLFTNLFEKEYRYTSATLVLGSRLCTDVDLPRPRAELMW